MLVCKHKVCSKGFEKHHYKQVFCSPQCKIDYWKDPVFQREYQKTHKEKNPSKRLLNGARDRARASGLPFNIDITDIVIPEYCPALGIKIGSGIRTGKGAKPDSPSLDRIVPELGYVKGNVQVLSFKANSMKRDASSGELAMFARWILNTQTEGE